MTRGLKSDAAALEHWGAAYAAIPKSAFALVAFHLASLAAENPGMFESIAARFSEEADALALSGIMPSAHAETVRKALPTPTKDSSQ